MQCKELEGVLADDVRALSREAQEHLAGCTACRDLVADFSAIVDVAKRIPSQVNPPDRIWVAVRAQLEAEKIIREPESVETGTTQSPWSGFAEFFRPRVLATAAVGILVVAGGLYLSQRPANRGHEPAAIAKVTTNAPTEAPNRVETAEAKPPLSVAPKHRNPGPRSAHVSVPAEPLAASGELRPSPTETAYLGDSAAVLTATESALPQHKLGRNAMVDASLRQNLRTINEFISECEARLKQDPHDQLTREYLNMAYQQKAELLTAMMDSGRSEQ